MTITTYKVIIYPCEDTAGYWAACDMPGGGCTVQAENLQEVQKSMIESVALYLEQSHGDENYFLDFIICEEAYA